MARRQPSENLRHLVRTYIYLNDPRVRQVTMKFTALALVVVLVVALYVAVLLSAPASTAPTADAAAALSAQGGAPGTQWACFPPGTSTAWVSENPDVHVVQAYEAADGSACFAYRTTPSPE